MSALTGYYRAPRSVIHVKAESDPKKLIAQLQEGFTQFRASYDKKFETSQTNVQAAIDDLNAKFVSMGMNGGAPGADLTAIDPEYSNLYAGWMRHGAQEDNLRAAQREGSRREVQASMSAGSATDGGYLAPTEWDRIILKKLVPLSPMRRLATVIPTSVRAYTTLWNEGGWGSGWVGETAQRPNTNTATLKPINFANGEIYANPAITQQLLDDADYPIEEWIGTELATEFSKQEGVAFIAGNGVNKPQGLLTYVDAATPIHPGGPLAVIPSGAAATLGTPDSLIDFVYGLAAPYRQNAKWLMNSTTAATIAKMKDGDGNYLWRETYVAGQPATLLGYAVEIDENMPSIAADALPIAFGDFKAGYVINDRIGVRILRDPYTNKPFVNFYTTKRVGGGVRDPNAIRLMKISAT